MWQYNYAAPVSLTKDRICFFPNFGALHLHRDRWNIPVIMRLPRYVCNKRSRRSSQTFQSASNIAEEKIAVY